MDSSASIRAPSENSQVTQDTFTMQYNKIPYYGCKMVVFWSMDIS